MSIEISFSDEQGACEVDVEALRELAAAALAKEGFEGGVELGVTFVDEARIAELHEAYLGEPGPTDVLSFPLLERDELGSRGARPAAPTTAAPLLLGDVVICPAVAARNAPDHAGSYEGEVALLLVHGILHLLGMDHEVDDEAEEMERRERELLGEYWDAPR